MIKKLLLIFLLTIPYAVFSQEKDFYADAQKVLKSSLKAEQKVDSLVKISFACYKSDKETALKIADLSQNLAQKIKYKNGEGNAFYLKARIEEKYGNIEKASEYCHKAVNLITDSTWLASAYLFDGWIYRRLSLKEKSIDASMKGLKIAEELKNNILIGDGYNGIAALYVGEKDYLKARQYHLLALKARQLAGNKRHIASSYINLGIVSLREKQFAKGIEYDMKALKIYEELKDTSSISFIYNDLGATYSQKGDQKNGIKYLKESIRLREAMKESNELAYTYNYLGEAYNYQGNYSEAEKWIRKALSFAIEIHNTKQNHEALESLSNFYASNTKPDSAYKYLKLYTIFGDSLKNIDRANALDELATQYETTKKEQQIEILNKDKALQKATIKSKNFTIAIVIILIVLIVLVAWFVIYERKAKEKLNLKNEVIKQQDLATKAVLAAEEKERRRISSDLHDGVGQMLSASLLNFNAFYQNIKNKLSPQEDEKAQTTLGLVSDSYDEMRSVSHQMMPNALLKSGLSTAVREFLHKIESENLKVILSINGLNQRLDEQTETVMYRIIQECVNNIIKHAKANQINIQITKDHEGLNCTVEDNGVGFDKKMKSEGIGLSNIKSRIAFLNGEVEIDSAIGKGTLVSIFIP